MGGITDGKLLAMAQAEFDGFVPIDRNLSFQEPLTRDVRRDPRREEKPGVRAISRAGALYRNGDTNRSAGVGEGGRVLLPRARIEVDSQKPIGFVFQERVGAHHVAALQVVDNDLVADRYEGLIHAVTAFASSLKQAQPRLPFVRAGGSVAGFAGPLAHEPDREHILTPAKQGVE
jgi:hypothetical protein